MIWCVRHGQAIVPADASSAPAVAATRRPVVGESVTVSPGYASCGDAGDGPLRPGVSVGIVPFPRQARLASGDGVVGRREGDCLPSGPSCCKGSCSSMLR